MMKYIILDAETNDHLDTFFEKRNWDGVTKEVIPIGQDITIIWKQRTPEEKGERPYQHNNEYLQTLSIPEYLHHKKEWIDWTWKNNQGEDRDLHEYCKGQFILLRELTEPEYRRSKP